MLVSYPLLDQTGSGPGEHKSLLAETFFEKLQDVFGFFFELPLDLKATNDDNEQLLPTFPEILVV